MILPLAEWGARYIAHNLRACDRELHPGQPSELVAAVMDRDGPGFMALTRDGLPAAMFGLWECSDGEVWMWAVGTERHRECGPEYARFARKVMLPGVMDCGRPVWALARTDKEEHARFLRWLGFRLDRLSENHAGEGCDYFVFVRRPV